MCPDLNDAISGVVLTMLDAFFARKSGFLLYFRIVKDAQTLWILTFTLFADDHHLSQ